MHVVTQYIERELLAHRSISLPFIGTLSLVRHGAILSPEGGVMTPPYDSLQIDSSIYDNATSLPDLLGSIDVYNEWYYCCIDASGSVLRIEGVCAIDLRSYELAVDDNFAQILMPSGALEPVAIGRSRAEIACSNEVVRASRRTVQRKSRSNWLLTVSLIVVIAAILYIIYTIFTR